MAAWVISWKRTHRIDDTLDVFAVHGMAGVAGALFVMLLGSPDAPAGLAGVLRGGEVSLLWREPLAIIITLAYAFGMTWLIATVMNRITPIRITSEDEYAGIDTAIHAESAYSLTPAGIPHPDKPDSVTKRSTARSRVRGAGGAGRWTVVSGGGVEW